MSRNPANNELPVGVNEPVDEESDEESEDGGGPPFAVVMFGPLMSYVPAADIPFEPVVRDAFSRLGYTEFDEVFFATFCCVLRLFFDSELTQEGADAAVDRFLGMFAPVITGDGESPLTMGNLPFVPAVRDAFARRGHAEFNISLICIFHCVLGLFKNPGLTPEAADDLVGRFLAMLRVVVPGGGY